MRLTGLGVSPGIGIGKALVLKRGTRELRFRVPPWLVPRELERLDDARARSRQQLEQIKERIGTTVGAEHAYLFDAQLLMLDDAMLIDHAAETIRTDRLNAESALQRALEHVSALFDQAEDPYLRERKGDVADVVGRIAMNLRAAGDPADLFKDIEGPLVLVAHEVTPSVIAQLDWQRLAALITDAGSWTYHTAILARSIHVPAVAGLHNASVIVAPGSVVAVDGTTGEVVVDPDADTLEHIQSRQRRRQAYELSLDEYRELAAVTEDGVEIRLEANIEAARRCGARARTGSRGHRAVPVGVPACRRRPGGPDRGVAVSGLSPARRECGAPSRDGPDLRRQRGTASDRARGHRGHAAPLGMRGVRLSLAFEEIFQAQLRALLRAAAHGPLRVMFPFVSGLEELARLAPPWLTQPRRCGNGAKRFRTSRLA